MLIKLTIIDTKSRFIFRTALKKCEDDSTIKEVFPRKNAKAENVVEVKAGFQNNLTTVDV